MSALSLTQFLYCSLLSADAPPTCVAEIIRAARPTNAALHVTGVLIFDGQRFCQYIEGPAPHVADLAQRIALDPRHTDFKPLHHGPLLGARRFQQWPMAYALAAEVEPLERMHAMYGLAAVDLLNELLPELDLGPAVLA